MLETGEYFIENPLPSLEFFFSLFLAIFVLTLCLIMSRIIRISDVLIHYLFGGKISEKESLLATPLLSSPTCKKDEEDKITQAKLVD